MATISNIVKAICVEIWKAEPEGLAPDTLAERAAAECAGVPLTVLEWYASRLLEIHHKVPFVHEFAKGSNCNDAHEMAMFFYGIHLAQRDAFRQMLRGDAR